TNPYRADGKPAAHAAPPKVHHVVQAGRDAGALQDHRHEDEQRDGDQREAVHAVPHLRGDEVEGVEAPGEVEEDDRHAAQHVGQRQAEHDEDQQRAEKQRCQQFDTHSQWFSEAPLGARSGGNATPAAIRMSLISFTIPCSSSRVAATGIMSLNGQMYGFQADWERSQVDMESRAMDTPKYSSEPMNRKNSVEVRMSITARARSGKRA